MLKKWISYTYKTNPTLQSNQTMLWVCFFLGFLGAHRYVMGYKYWWVMFLTIGGLGMWTMIDLWHLYVGTMTMANGEELKK
jgi:hypothetical protein